MANTLSFDDSQPTEVVESLSAQEQDSLRIGEQLEQEQQNLLAGKYKSAEELEQGYLELQRKMGEGQPNQQAPSDVSDQLAKAYESYTSDKKFDASAFDNVSKEDLIKAFFENSEEVPQAAEDNEGPDLTQDQVDGMMNSVGGKEQYQQIMNWAVQNLPKSDIEAFDAIVESANPFQINMAVEAMAKRYTDANGQDGKMIQGRSASTGVESYRSQAEMIRDMNDPRYDTDPAYRNDVMTKLANSPNLQF